MAGDRGAGQERGGKEVRDSTVSFYSFLQQKHQLSLRNLMEENFWEGHKKYGKWWYVKVL